jgi:hypothetical protein
MIPTFGTSIGLYLLLVFYLKNESHFHASWFIKYLQADYYVTPEICHLQIRGPGKLVV